MKIDTREFDKLKKSAGELKKKNESEIKEWKGSRYQIKQKALLKGYWTGFCEALREVERREIKEV